MTQTITSLGEIGAAGGPTPSGLTPLDLPILRDGATWNLTGYDSPAIDVWELRTRSAIVTPGAVQIQDATNGVIRWTPDYSQFPSGIYEARIRVSPDGGGTYEASGLFRFSIGASSH